MIKSDALRIIGGPLVAARKMPCPGFATPAERCNVGSRLRSVPGSVCSICYACKGSFRFPCTVAANERRHAALDHPLWVDAMVRLVSGHPFFRWYVSGDIRDLAVLRRIVAVAERTPETRHWLPTREYSILRSFLRAGGTFPSNLTVRVSAPMIDGPVPSIGGLPGSGVHFRGPFDPETYICPASLKVGGVCGTCRACWDPSVRTVSYAAH